MKVIAINGSPRKKGNTAELLKRALEGAEENGAKTKLYHLYDLEYTGCVSCFACKKKGNDCKGLCVVKDDLKDVLEEILKCDALIIGSPIYFSDVTGEIRSFLERLLFPILSYKEGERELLKKSIPSAFIYTMNVPKEHYEEAYKTLTEKNQSIIGGLLRAQSKILVSCDTYQFKDYDKYDATRYSIEEKEKVRKEQFPLDLQEAFAIGKQLAVKL
jgi:multimeric flavodoxin WrbA